jgi:gliding motility-associated-like protein
LGVDLGINNDTAINLLSGTYDVRVEDIKGCFETGQVTVEQPSVIDISPIAFDSASCNGLATGSAWVGGASGVTGGNGGYVYSWTDGLGVDLGINNDTAINLLSGTYDVRVEDIKGCFETGQVTVEQPSSLFLSDTILDSATCSTGGTVLVTVTGGAPNYSYEWSDGANQDTDTAVNLASGIYKVVVTDNNGCKDSITNVTVPVIGGVTVVVDTVIDILCFGAITGGINITTNGVLPISYSWTGPNGYTSTSEDITNLAAGNYSVTITDGNSCVTAIDTVITTPASDISIIKEFTDLKCFNDSSGSIEVKSVSNGSAPYVYNWTGPNGYTSSSEDITNLAAGVYVLSLTDNNLCTLDNDSTIVLEPDTVSITYVLTQPGCGANDGSILVTPSGGGGDSNPPNSYNYSWVDLDVGPAVIGTASLLDNIGSGLYEVTVTDDSSCVGSKSVNVSDINGPLVEDSTVDVTCNNDTDGEIFLTVTTQPSGNAYGIDWDIDNFIGSAPDDLDGLPDSLVETGLPPGVYFVRVTDSSNGCLTVHSDTVFDPGPIVLTPRFVAPTCFGLSNGKAYPENISGGNGGYSYSWSDVDNQLTDTAFNLAIGSYTLTVTDSKFCLDSMTVDVTQPDSIYLSLYQDSVKCFGDSNGIAFPDSISGGSGGFTYSWDLFAVDLNSNNANNDTAIGLYARQWTLTVEDQNGCNKSLEIEVLQPEILAIGSMIMDSLSCNGLSDGKASAVGITGGNGVNSFIWTDAFGVDLLQDNDTAVGLSAETYTIEVTDQNNCSATADILVEEPNALTIDSIYQESVKCYGFADGRAVISNISGGTGYGYNFTWTDSLGNNLFQDSSTAVTLSAGVYNITVTDQLLCSIDTNVTVLEPNTLTLDTLNIINPLCSSSSDGSVNLITNGGTNPYSFVWTDSLGVDLLQDNDTAVGLSAGIYYALVTDTNGCTAKDTVTLIPVLEILANAGMEDTLVCFGDSLTLTGTSSGAINPSISWNLLGASLSFDSTIIYTFEDSSTYIYDFVFVVSEQTCTDRDSVKITVAPLPTVDAGNDVDLSFGSSFDLGGTPTGPVNSSYIWTPLTNFVFESDSIDENPEIEFNSSEIYIVLVTDSNGCINSDTIKVNLIPDIVVPSAFSPNGDGINDVWIIEIPQQFTNVTVRVYNRWGSLVYDRAQAGGENWTGNGNNSKSIPVGTYYYIIEYIDFDGQKDNMNGPITIIR